MAPGSRTTRRSLRVNTSIDPTGELDELAGAQGLAKGSNADSNEAPTPPETPTPLFVPPTSEELFTKFMKVSMKSTQAREQLEPRERPLKARTPETYSGKSHMDCYQFC